MANWRQWGTQGTKQPGYGSRTVQSAQPSTSAGNSYQTTVLSNHNQDNLKPGINTTAINRGNTDGGGNVDLSGTVVNRDTIYLNDGAGLGNKATWGVDLLHKPTTISGYGITDAQGALANAPGNGYVLMRDSGGTPYWALPFPSSEFSAAGTSLATTTFGTTEMQIGYAIGFSSYLAGATLVVVATGDAGWASTVKGHFVVQYSLNDGSTWTTIGGQDINAPSTGQNPVAVTGVQTFGSSGTNALVRLGAYLDSGSSSFYNGRLSAFIIPAGNTFLVGPGLSASMSSTESGTATATYPTTSATATTTVPVTASGGTPSYTYAAAVVSGPGSLVNGTTANPEVKLTETTTDPGTAYNTVINSTVTDSASNTATTGNCTVTQTFTQQYAALSLSVSTTSGVCSTTGAGCTATGSASVSVSGGSGSYSYSWAVTSGTATLATPSASSTNVSNSEAAGASESVTVQVTVSDPKVSSANASGTLSLQAIKIS